MLRRLSAMILLVAMLLAPLAMIAGPASAHAPQAAPMAGHCTEMGGDAAPDKGEAGLAIDCMMMCSAMLPGFAPVQRVATAAVGLDAIPARDSLTGSEPGLELPPPRVA